MLKILVAEDDRNLAHYYKTLLNQWNCEAAIVVPTAGEA